MILPLTRPRLLLALLAALLAPGCVLWEKPTDLFPVCEDRRANGPSPALTVDELVARVDVRGEAITEKRERGLLAPLRERILTLQGAPYVTFHGNLTSLGDGTWRFEGRGTGGPAILGLEVDDSYRFRLRDDNGSLRVEDERPHAPYPAAAPPTLERAAWLVLNRTREMDEARAETPHLVISGVDPDLPACVFLVATDGADARTLFVVNMVSHRVVHVDRGASFAS